MTYVGIDVSKATFVVAYSLYINFYYYLCIKLQHQGVE